MSRIAKVKFKEGLYQVIGGKYCVGRIGHIEAGKIEGNKLGNEMFYSIEGEYPYCICLRAKDLAKVE